MVASEIVAESSKRPREREAPRIGRLLNALKGVPKAALRTVLGKELGSRTWNEARGGTTAGFGVGVRDCEILEGLIGHLSRTAARTLRGERRMARSVSVYVTYADRSVCGASRRLSGITQDATAIFEESRMVFEGLPKRAAQVVNLELRVGSVAAETSSEQVGAGLRIAEAVGVAG